MLEGSQNEPVTERLFGGVELSKKYKSAEKKKFVKRNNVENGDPNSNDRER